MYFVPYLTLMTLMSSLAAHAADLGGTGNAETDLWSLIATGFGLVFLRLREKPLDHNRIKD